MWAPVQDSAFPSAPACFLPPPMATPSRLAMPSQALQPLKMKPYQLLWRFPRTMDSLMTPAQAWMRRPLGLHGHLHCCRKNGKQSCDWAPRGWTAGMDKQTDGPRNQCVADVCSTLDQEDKQKEKRKKKKRRELCVASCVALKDAWV